MELLHVSASGTRSAPTILFLHGIGAAGWMWGRQIAALPDFRCLTVDLPGHGRSNHIPWISFAETADHVANLIRTRATNGPAHVVGLSLGGHVVLELLARHSNLVDRAIVSGVTDRPWPNRWALPLQLALVSAVMKRRWSTNRMVKSMQVPSDLEPALREGLEAMSMSTYRRIYREGSTWHAPPSLRDVGNPTLIVAGGNEVAMIKTAAEAIAGLMPNAEAIVAPRLGHGWNVEDPTLFSEMVRTWVTGDPLPSQLQRIG